jgi:hypothetical protein
MRRCETCSGAGWYAEYQDGLRIGISCVRCRGRGQLPVTHQEMRRWHRMLKMEAPLQPLHPPPTLIIVTLPPREEAS